MKPSRLLVGSLAALGATGCLATKGDIRLLQDEVRAAHNAVARADSAHRRTSDSLAAALASLASMQARGDQALQRSQQQLESRLSDDLKGLGGRVSGLELTTKEKFKSLDDDLTQVREIARQGMRGSAVSRAAQEQAAIRPPAAVGADSAPPPTQSVAAGPATLLLNGRSLIIQGSCSTARRSFQAVLSEFPESVDAPEAQFLIGESFVSCGEGGNPARADSVYSLVTEKYPKSDFAATSLYKRAELQRNAGKPELARPFYARVVCEYPKSTVYDLALGRLGSRPVCR